MSPLLLLSVLWGRDFLLASVYFSYFRSRVLSEALDNNTDGIYWIYIYRYWGKWDRLSLAHPGNEQVLALLPSLWVDEQSYIIFQNQRSSGR